MVSAAIVPTSVHPDVPLREALIASAAAKPFLPEVEIDGHVFVDGGFLVNNPCAVGLEQARRLFSGRTVDAVVSIGTGEGPPRTSAIAPTMLEYFSMAKDLMLDSRAAFADMVHHEPPAVAARFVRLQPRLRNEFVLDAADKVREIAAQASEWLETPGARHSLDDCAELLLASMLYLEPAGKGDLHDLEPAPAGRRQLKATLKCRHPIDNRALHSQLRPDAFRVFIEGRPADDSAQWTWPEELGRVLAVGLQVSGLPPDGQVRIEVQVNWRCLSPAGAGSSPSATASSSPTSPASPGTSAGSGSFRSISGMPLVL